LSALADAYPRTPIIVALSADYLNAIEADLLGVLEKEFFREHLAIISCGTQSGHPLWKNNLLPCDARHSGALGGSLTSLNSRVARFLFLSGAADPTVRHLATIVRSIEVQENKSLAGVPQSDTDVSQFIRSRLRIAPSASKTKLLKEFRALGRACEQKRFGTLCAQLREEIQRDLYA
jgi:hypothetical protein